MGLFTATLGNRQSIGNALDWVGGKLGIPETGLSEFVAGGPTGNTGRAYAQQAPAPNNRSTTLPSSYIGPPGPGQSVQPGPVTQGLGNVNLSNLGGGGGGTSQLQQLAQTDRNPIQETEYQRLLAESQAGNREAQVRNDINSGYDAYFNQLNDIMNQGLPQQRTAQEQIAQSQYDQGLNQLGTQRTLGLQDLGAQSTKATNEQNRTLKDISENVRNLFQSGNTYLGSLGAGDSSAANQYSYALTKLGSKQRGNVQSQYADIQNDIAGRETRLNEIYNSETNNLKSQLDQQIAGISQWFAEQQNALKQAQAQGQLAKGQDLASLSQNLLNVALQNLQNVKAEAANRRSALEQWAMSNAQNINQLKQNFASISTVNPIFPQAQSIQGMPQVGSAGGLFGGAPIGFGVSSDEERNRFA